MSVAATTDVFFNSSPMISSSSDSHCLNTEQTNSQEQQILKQNKIFTNKVVDSSDVSLLSTEDIVQTPINIVQQDVSKILVSPTKHYVSSFKTLTSSTNQKQSQRLNFIDKSVMILKLSKHNENDNTVNRSPSSSKYSALSIATTTTSASSKSTQQQTFSSIRLSPILKVEGKKRRTVPNDSSIIIPPTVDTLISSNSTNQMATTTSSHLQTNSSVFTYRSAAAGGNSVRQRALAETTANSILISSERYKSNVTSSIRPTRPSLTTTSSFSSTYTSTQQTQRNFNQTNKSRAQQDKFNNPKEIYEYPDPFTSCPQDLLNKLAQLTKLQLETIEWEKKKRFAKKKPITNTTTQGKDSP